MRVSGAAATFLLLGALGCGAAAAPVAASGPVAAGAAAEQGAASGAPAPSLAAASATAPPDQPAAPVNFSHKVHAGDNQIGCGVCHAYARHSPNAGLAPASVCMGCHKFVGKDKPGVMTMAAAFAAGHPVSWTRVNRVPDHVFFSHQRHLAKGIECKSCHGDVASMTLDVKVHDLQMGFCMDCHRQKQATVDCLTCHK